MRSFRLLLAAGLVAGCATAAWADSPYPMTSDYHDPIDLKAYTPPGPKPGTDGTGTTLVEPPRPADAAKLNDPNEVKWPTLDKSEWDVLKGHYTVAPKK
jgi:hypothetical protein